MTSKTVKNMPELLAALAYPNTIITLAPVVFVGQAVVTKPNTKIIASPNSMITCKNSYSVTPSNQKTACLQVLATDFTAVGVSVNNTAGIVGGQALALFVNADRAVFKNCKFSGQQDTVFVGTGRQYFSKCRIAGSVDFIYGNGAAFFDACDIHVRNRGTKYRRDSLLEKRAGGMYAITAPGKDFSPTTGIIISYGKVTADAGVTLVSLGRGWGNGGTAVFQYTSFPAGLVDPVGWRTMSSGKSLAGFHFGIPNCVGVKNSQWPKVNGPKIVTQPIDKNKFLSRTTDGCKTWYSQ